MESASPARIEARLQAARGIPQPIPLPGRLRIWRRAVGMTDVEAEAMEAIETDALASLGIDDPYLIEED